MKIRHLIFNATLLIAVCLSLNVNLAAQAISGVEAIPPNTSNSKWVINISFVPVPRQEKIKQIFLLNVEDAKIIKLDGLTLVSHIYTASLIEPLETAKNPRNGRLELAKHYELKASVENNAGNKILSLGGSVELFDEVVSDLKVEKARSKSVDDSDVYISGELNDAHRRQASFTAEIKLQRNIALTSGWSYKPFFNLTASTDPGADPDKMEIGLGARYIIGSSKSFPGAYFDNDVKLESERDFDNTNLIYDTRLTFLPSIPTKAASVTKVFFNPFIGAELGKNLRSPLKKAEGDGIARLLIGADLRFAFFLTGGDQPDINWVTSYTRRRLLTDELGFKADENGKLFLTRYGKGQRDHVLSKLSYKLTNFLNVFVAYEWGQTPPSYKFIDHRFRLGFAYKYKFSIR